jgi:iron complex outermembrane recepter protein
MAFRKQKSEDRGQRAVRAAFKLPVLTLAISIANALAQDTQQTQRVEPITVTARSAPILEAENADVGGFNAPLVKTPQSISVLGSDLLRANATQTLSQALKLDASLTDNYNASGYIESLAVRGFVLNQVANFRRNGLATSNYAPLALENKERIEVLKGVSGLQSGVSTPGGLVNYVTKKPLRDAFTSLAVDANHFGNAKVHIDSNQRIGTGGLRLNLVGESLRNQFDSVDGSRALVSLAYAQALSPATSLFAEFEFHRKSQPSVPALGLLDRDGDGVAETLPRLDRRLQRLNLNSQSWSLPVQSSTTQFTTMLDHRINDRWKLSTSLGHFNSKLNDRVAFPDGCSNSNNYVYPGLCGNGDVDIYDFRSDNERRALTSGELKLSGRVDAVGATHQVQVALSGYRNTAKFPARSAYNYAGFTNIYAPLVVNEAPALDSLNTNSSDRSFDVALSLQSQWSERFASFAGARIARYSRASVRSDGSEAVRLSQTSIAPWIGMTYSLSLDASVYASFSTGEELENVPNRPALFYNYSSVLNGRMSKQFELGSKWKIAPRLLATASLFSIEKPFADDLFNADGLRTRIAGGKEARHRGVELSATGRVNESLSLQASATYMDARYTRALEASLIDKRAVNVPRVAASVFANYKVAALNGLSLNALVWTQRGKTATASGNVQLPAAFQIDVGASYEIRVFAQPLTLRLNVENATDRVYWREAPTTSWGGIYLFPSTPRTVKLGATLEF